MSRLDSFGVVVLDLDDTLYPESEYVRSGFQHVGELVERLYGVPFVLPLMEAWKSGARDALGAALEGSGLPSGLKDHLVAAYRYHRPTLSLYPGAGELVARCRERGCPLYLVSDGRGVTQRLKLEALGLLGVFEEIFISEEVGVGKPDPLAFRTIMSRGGAGPWVYVADNPAKDFVAPNALGWTSFGVRHTSNRVHGVDRVVCEPTYWVDELADLLE